MTPYQFIPHGDANACAPQYEVMWDVGQCFIVEIRFRSTVLLSISASRPHSTIYCDEDHHPVGCALSVLISLQRPILWHHCSTFSFSDPFESRQCQRRRPLDRKEAVGLLPSGRGPAVPQYDRIHDNVWSRFRYRKPCIGGRSSWRSANVSDIGLNRHSYLELTLAQFH